MNDMNDNETMGTEQGQKHPFSQTKEFAPYQEQIDREQQDLSVQENVRAMSGRITFSDDGGPGALYPHDVFDAHRMSGAMTFDGRSDHRPLTPKDEVMANRREALHALWLANESESAKKKAESDYLTADLMGYLQMDASCTPEEKESFIGRQIAATYGRESDPYDVAWDLVMQASRGKAEFEANAEMVRACKSQEDFYRAIAKLDEKHARHQADDYKQASKSIERMAGWMAGGDDWTQQDWGNVVGALTQEQIQQAKEVREWMVQNVKPLNKEENAEAALRKLDGMRKPLLAFIGDDKEKAVAVYGALMLWAQQMSDSNKVGVWDEFKVSVGKKLSNWSDAIQAAGGANAVTMVGMGGAGMATAGMGGVVPSLPATMSKAEMEQAQANIEQAEREERARAMLRSAVNAGIRISDSEHWLKGGLRATASMAGETAPYLIPYVGSYAGTVDALVTGTMETSAQYRLDYLTNNQGGYESEDAADVAAARDTAVQAAVELLPFGHVGGMGLSKVLQLCKRKPGSLSAWVTKQTQRNLATATLAEGGASFLDEAVLEPFMGGIATLGTDWVFDKLGVQHGQSADARQAFNELGAIWTDPKQLLGLTLFTAVLTGAHVPGLRANVRRFTKDKNMLQAAGLSETDAVQIADMKDAHERVRAAQKAVQDGWKNDPEGMHARLLAKNKELADKGSVLFYTGQSVDPSLDPNGELAPAYAAVWQHYVDEGVLPAVEQNEDGLFHITKTNAMGESVLDVTLDAVKADSLLMSEIDALDKAMADAQRGRFAPTMRGSITTQVEKIAGRATERALKENGEAEGVDLKSLTDVLPTPIAARVKAQGYFSVRDMQDTMEWARGQIDALVKDGVTEEDAAKRPYAQGVAQSYGDLMTWAAELAAGFTHRADMAGMDARNISTAVFRQRGARRFSLDGRDVLSSMIYSVEGGAKPRQHLEDVVESYLDQVAQARAAALQEEGKSAEEADEQAWKEIGEKVKAAREAALAADGSMEIEAWDDSRMSIIENFSTLAVADFLHSEAVPAFMRSMQAAARGVVQAASAIDTVHRALEAARKSSPEATAGVEQMLSDMGVRVQRIFGKANIEAKDLLAWQAAHARANAKAQGPGGVGGQAVTQARQEAEEHEQEIAAHEKAPTLQAERDKKAEEPMQRAVAMQPQANAPQGMQGVFVGDQCVHQPAGNFYCGRVPKTSLRDGTEQVKKGAKGKHGVIAGRELTGDFEQTAAPLYVWQRTNGELWVISGRHRFAKIMEDDSATDHFCYVFREGDEFAGTTFDEKWARMMDYENNMRDDQADEVTAGVYARETGASDSYMHARGLLRNGSRSKRGIFIGRNAGEELWARFYDGAIEPKDAEIICNMTRGIKDRSRVSDIQTRCCVLLEQKKSWEYIGAMAQLLANKEAVTMKQGLLDLGADFEADMERMATFIEKNLHSLNEAISLLKGEKKRAKQGDKAGRLGLAATMTDEQRDTMLDDLNALKAQFELIGSYPDLVAAAQMWDGTAEIDPVAQYLERAAAEREQAQLEAGMDAETYLEEQERKEAEEKTPMLFSMSLDKDLKNNVDLALAHRLKSDTEVRIGSCPWLLWFFGEKSADLVTWARNLSKMRNDHKLSAEQIVASFDGMRDPQFLIKDTPTSYIFIPGTMGINKHGNMAEVEVPVQLEKTPDGKHFAVSAYPFDSLQKVEILLKKGTLLYSRYSKAELSTNGVPEGFTQDFIRLVVKFGFTKNTITLDDIVKENNSFSAPIETAMFNDGDTSFSIRTEAPPIKTGIGYKVFFRGKDGKLYPPMVANPGGADTPVGVWLDADEGTRAPDSKTGRPQVKAGGKGTRGGSGSLAYRPGWHLGEIPYALQFNRLNPETGKRDLFPNDFVWAEVEYAADVDYQVEAEAEGITASGKFQHSLAGLKRLPKDGFYRYRTNPNPQTDPWIITGAMKVNRILSREEVDSIVRAAGREPQKVQEPSFSADNLAAAHTLSVDKFLAVAKLGGMPVPSIAITRLDKPYSWGGSDAITLIGVPRLGQPGPGNRVYFHDAYTGKMPRMFHKKKNEKKLSKLLSEKIKPELEPYGLDSHSSLRNSLFRNDNDSNAIDSDDADIRNNPALRAYWAISEKGYKPKPKMMENPSMFAKDWARFDSSTKRRLTTWHKNSNQRLTDADIRKFCAIMRDWYEAHPVPLASVQQKMLEMFADAEVYIDSNDRWETVRKARLFQSNMTEGEHKTAKIPDFINNAKVFSAFVHKHEAEFNEWADRMKADFVGESLFKMHRIVKNLRGDIIDDRWEIVPATLTNLTRYMRQEKGRGEEMGSVNAGMFLALMSDEMKGKREVSWKRDRVISSDEFEAANNEYQDKFYAFSEAVNQARKEKSYYSDEAEIAFYNVAELKSKGKILNRDNIVAALEQTRGVEWTPELLAQGVELVQLTQTMPTDYMEAIPMRAVKLDEFRFAIMPESLRDNAEVNAILENSYMEPIYHDGTKEGYNAAMASLVGSFVSFSMERATLDAMELLRGRAEESVGEKLLKDWRKACEQWAMLGSKEDGRLGKGAKLLAEMNALIAATRKALQGRDGLGRLDALMRWATVYAEMQQSGQAPRSGRLQGDIFQQFAQRMARTDETNRLQGMTDAEAREAMAEIAGERLDAAMMKVARHCAAELDAFLKARARERMDLLRDRLYPKRDEGKPWPRGKMSADMYRRVERIYEVMEMENEKKADLLEVKKQQMAELDRGLPDFEEREEALSEEIAIISTYGCWETMDAAQARKAEVEFTNMLREGRTAWDNKLKQERARTAWVRKEILSHFKTEKDKSVSEGGAKVAAERGKLKAQMQKMLEGNMNFNQLMLALTPYFGKRFCAEQRRRITEIHSGTMTYLGQLEGWMYDTLAKITGLQSETEIERWLNKHNQRYDTGIVLDLPEEIGRATLTMEEARTWLSLTKSERAARREQMQREAEENMEQPQNVPSEQMMLELAERVVRTWLWKTEEGKKRWRDELKAEKERLGHELSQEERSALRLSLAQELALSAKWATDFITPDSDAKYTLVEKQIAPQALETTNEAMLFAILTFEQPDYEHLMEANGLTESKLQQMREKIGPELLEWGYAMRDYLNEQGLALADVYEEWTGIPFASRAAYFRGVFDVGIQKDGQPEAPDREGGASAIGGKHGILIPRRYHNQRIPWQQMTSATATFLQTAKEQHLYMQTSQFVHEWNALLSNKEFARRLTQELGDATPHLLKGWVQLIEGSVVGSSRTEMALTRIVGKWLGAYAVTRLFGNIYTLMKQASAVHNGFMGGYVPEEMTMDKAGTRALAYRHIGPGEYTAAFARVMSMQGVFGIEEMAKQDFLQHRMTGKGAKLTNAANLAPNQKVPGVVGSAARAFTEFWGNLIGKVDVGANVMAACALADAAYHTIKQEDTAGIIPEEAAKAEALRCAAAALDTAAQPVLRTQKSYFVARGSFGSIGKNLYLFRSEAVAKFGLVLSQIQKGETGYALGGALMFGVMNSFILAFIDWLRGYWPGDDDDDKWQKRGAKFGFNVLMGDLASVPILDVSITQLRKLMEDGIYKATDVDVRSKSFQDEGVLEQLWKAGNREADNIDKGASWDRHLKSVATMLDSLGSITGIMQNSTIGSLADVATLTLAAATAGNISKFVSDVVRKATGEE